MISTVTSTAEQAEYRVQMPIRDWLTIDGTMDNHVQTAIGGGLDDDTEAGNEDPDPGTEDDDDSGSGSDSDDEDGWDAEDVELSGVAQLGLSIRQAGWDQLPDWPHDAEGLKTWPAPGQTATMTLTGSQWDLVITALHHWAAVDDRLQEADSAAECRAIAAAIQTQLAQQGRHAG